MTGMTTAHAKLAAAFAAAKSEWSPLPQEETNLLCHEIDFVNKRGVLQHVSMERIQNQTVDELIESMD